MDRSVQWPSIRNGTKHKQGSHWGETADSGVAAMQMLEALLLRVGWVGWVEVPEMICIEPLLPNPILWSNTIETCVNCLRHYYLVGLGWLGGGAILGSNTIETCVGVGPALKPHYGNGRSMTNVFTQMLARTCAHVPIQKCAALHRVSYQPFKA